MGVTTIRKVAIILVVAVLYSIFVFSLADAIIPEREYPSACQENIDKEERYRGVAEPLGRINCTELAPASQELIDACPGDLQPEYEGGCASGYVCWCHSIADDFDEQERNIRFWVALVLGGIAIIVGMLLPDENELNEWIGGGFIIGGLVTVFIATAMYWSEIHKILRPIVIAIELVLVLWISYRKFTKKK